MNMSKSEEMTKLILDRRMKLEFFPNSMFRPSKLIIVLFNFFFFL